MSVGTPDRMCIIEDVLQDVWSWLMKYSDCVSIISGDWNTDLEKRSDASNYYSEFFAEPFFA